MMTLTMNSRRESFDIQEAAVFREPVVTMTRKRLLIWL